MRCHRTARVSDARGGVGRRPGRQPNSQWRSRADLPKLGLTASRGLVGRARNHDGCGTGWNAGDELRLQRRLEGAARAGPQIPARALSADHRATRAGRVRALRQGAVERDRRHGLDRRGDPRGVRRRRPRPSRACACWPRSWARRWRRCRSPPRSISPARPSSPPAARRRRRPGCRSWPPARRSARWRWPKAPARPMCASCAPPSAAAPSAARSCRCRMGILRTSPSWSPRASAGSSSPSSI